VRERHLAWCLALVDGLDVRWWLPAQVQRLPYLERELDNLRAALGWAQDAGQLREGLQLAQLLGPFWIGHAHRSEGLRWLERFLALTSLVSRRERPQEYERAATPGTLRAWTLLWAAELALTQTEPRQAAEVAAQSLALLRQRDDREGMVYALHLQGAAERDAGDYRQSAALLEESVRLWQEVGPSSMAIGPAWNLAITKLQQGDSARAAALLEECRGRGWMQYERCAAALCLVQSLVAWEREDLVQAKSLGEAALARYRTIGDRRTSALALGYLLGQVAREQGDLDRAVALCEESLALGRDLGDGGIIGWASLGLGLAFTEQGEQARAEAALVEGLDCFWTRGMRWFLARCLAGFVGVAGAQGQAQRAAWLAGATAALIEQTGAPLPRGERAPYARALATACAVLGEEAYAAAWAAGQTAPLEEVVASARPM
jgi:tetratricopeptide (TPR) repeat protein